MPRVGITAYDLLISCPGDVNQFTDIIRECVGNFNEKSNPPAMLGRIE